MLFQEKADMKKKQVSILKASIKQLMQQQQQIQDAIIAYAKLSG